MMSAYVFPLQAMNPRPIWILAMKEMKAERQVKNIIDKKPLFLPITGRVRKPTPIIEAIRVTSDPISDSIS